MGSKVKVSHRYPILSFVLFSFSLILMLISTYYSSILIMFLMASCMIFGMILFMTYLSRLHGHMEHLVEMCMNIIDQKDTHIETIDGESSIAVLSSQLVTLDKRMKGMVERLHDEQVLLKDYIEDISHQMKTPLTSMILREEFLLETIEDDKQKEYIEHIYHQTIKMKNLIEALLNLAKVESHSIEYQKKDYDLEELLLQIKETLNPLLETYHVSLNMNVKDVHIYCDEKWMIEALENIIKNCVEQKENSFVDISCTTHSSYLEIVIKDYGNGIDKDDLPHIFERFYQSKSRPNKGIGIGLAMSKGIIDAHHGIIEAMNDDGALFKITLPYNTAKSKYTVTK